MNFRSFVLASLWPLAVSYTFFQKRIPNGDSIPFSCKPGRVWEGVGHLIDDGAGSLNPFGHDFQAAGYEWTPELCRKDSDGDGYTNGYEVGDLNCTWTVGGTPDLTIGLSHPGICDPWDSELCLSKQIISDKYSTQAEWLDDQCQSDEFKCAALADKDIRNFTARLPEGTPVPPQGTHYICRAFSIYDLGVPRGRDHHVVAVTPIVDNNNVVHHMIVFGCTGYMEPNSDPYPCMVTPHPSCQDFMFLWTIGLNGECLYPDTGVRIGDTQYEYFIIQYHWSNMELRSDFTDSSGMVFHYTPNLKMHDTSVFAVGSTYFELPPRMKYTEITSNCASGCTNTLLKGSINITAAGNHMHLLGKDMFVEIKRGNVHIAYITNDRFFLYDTPQVHHYPHPLQVFPGDSIVTRCGFSTLSRDEITDWGDGTKDEMCFAFITYYPKQNVIRPNCVDIMGLGMCEENSFEGCISLHDFIRNIGNTRVFNENELAKANGQGYEFLSRIAPCKQEADRAMTSDPDTK